MQFEIILAELGQVAAPTVQREDIVLPHAQENGQRWHVEAELFEKGFTLIEQGLDGRRDSPLYEDGEGLADFSVRSGQFAAEGEDLFELIEDQVGDPILVLATMEMKPKTAGGVFG